MSVWILLAAAGVWWYARRRSSASAPTGAIACNVTRTDGPWTICLRRHADGWTWEANRSPAPGHTTTHLAESTLHESQDDALAAAWHRLVDFPVEYVTEVPIDRSGLTLATNGFMTVADTQVWVTFAAGPLDAEQIAGHEPIVQLVRVLQQALSQNWNPLRVQIDRVNFVCASDPAQCTLQAAAARLADAGGNPVARAKAVFGIP